MDGLTSQNVMPVDGEGKGTQKKMGLKMKLSQLKLSKQFDPSHKSYGFTVR